jgi:choline dehydrogenase-like flavoprotein
MPLPTTSFGVVVFGTIVPAHENYVRLDPTLKDEFGCPMLDIHIHYDAEVPRTMAAAWDRLRAIMESAGYRCTAREPLPPLTPGTSVHYGGTVRMHSLPKYGMLNAWNRLHAVDNVVVADASSFTTGVEKNPTLTAMALAARAADRLAEDLKLS